MADNISLRISTDGIKKKFDSMTNKAMLAKGWLNRVAYPMIIEAQRMRWASEGASEGSAWAPLNASYAIRKLKKYKDAPGGGRKMLIATSRLVAGVTGDNTADHYKLVTDKMLMVGTRIGYAKYVNEARNFVKLGSATMKNLSDSLGEYLRG
jgi:hypothetical protein